MDASRVKNDGDSVYSVAKKNKKRKNDEISDLGAEDLADEVPRKKMKTKILGGISDVVFGEGTDKSSRKEKKKKDKSRIDVNAQEDGNKREGKIKKDKTGDKGEMKKKKKNKSEKRKDAEFAGADDRVGDADANQIDNGVTNVELVEGQKRKRKKDRKNHYVNATSGGEVSENTCDKRKEKSVRSNMKGDVNAGVSETEKVNGTISHGDLVESQMNNEGTENIQSVKEKKRRNKKKDNRGVDSLDKEPKKNRKENSIGSYIDRNVTGILKDNESNKKSKKVKFSDNVEVFPHISSKKKKKKAVKDGGEEKKTVKDGGKEKKKVDDGLIRGKRFSKEEDEIIQNAVYKYIEDHQLGEEGLEMVLNCRSHPEIKNCWKEIGEALPQRPYVAVYTRAHILFERSEARKWTPDEIELLKTFVKKHGPDWKTLSIELGKHRFHVKDAWRRYKFPNLKKGNWSVEEYEKLFNLVNMDLSMKAYTEKKTKYGMLRDNICWEAISEELSTRSNPLCCMRWYNQLTSPMVAEGKWDNADDYRLLIALNEFDAACEEDVDWDNLLEHRTGDICRKRWNQMVRHIGENGTKLFSEQVEFLSRRYCPDLLDAREAYDNKPPVD